MKTLENKPFTKVQNNMMDKVAAKTGCNGLAVYTILCRYAYGDDNSCFPCMETMCKTLHISRPRLIRTINDLETYGFITVDRGGWKNTNSYHINLTDTELRRYPTTAFSPAKNMTGPKRSNRPTVKSTIPYKHSDGIFDEYRQDRNKSFMNILSGLDEWYDSKNK